MLRENSARLLQIPNRVRLQFRPTCDVVADEIIKRDVRRGDIRPRCGEPDAHEPVVELGRHGAEPRGRLGTHGLAGADGGDDLPHAEQHALAEPLRDLAEAERVPLAAGVPELDLGPAVLVDR